jgi:hypothetical protein
MNTMHELNFKGHAALAFVGNIIVNGVVQPLCTVKNCLMANEKLFGESFTASSRVKFLFRGFRSICIADTTSYLISLYVTEWFHKKEYNLFYSSVSAGIVSSPAVAFWESVMVQEQIHGPIKHSKKEIFWKAMSRSGLLATTLREIPFNVGLFAVAPSIRRFIPSTNEIAVNLIAGALAGGFSGALTAPFDIIKTRIQAHDIPFKKAVIDLSQELKTPQGQRAMLLSTGFRALYMGLAIAILNVANNQLPHIMPKICFSQNE